MKRWADKELVRRRKEYLDECRAIMQIWDRRIASKHGRLPGATLDAITTPLGWCGQVQLVPGLHHTGDVRDATDDIADVYELPRGAVLVDFGRDGTADTAFIWAFRRPSHVDYHERRPMSVFQQDFAGETTPPGQLTRLERAELRDWTRKYVYTWRLLYTGHAVDTERLVRRLNRMRGAILDALTRVEPDEVMTMLTDVGMVREALPEDIADRLNWSRR